MPYTHVEIEEHKTRRLLFLFAVLLFLYFGSIIVLVLGGRCFIGFSGSPQPQTVAVVFLIALATAVVHWMAATRRLVDRVLSALMARPLDTEDTYHKQLRNIVEEVSVATGGRRIEPYVIATPAMNACAISDFEGRSAIAVTEGLLARLNRPQLEAVIGHEAAHIANGDSLFKSVFIGLFGLHEEALRRLTGLFSGRSGMRLRGRGAALIFFVMLVLWVTNKLKRLCEMLISRTQEYRADAVAVRLTRNPLALAEALRRISGHWRGVGAHGESLSTLFILDTGGERLSEESGLTAELFSTHPPTDKRVALLLGMGSIQPEVFEQEMARKAARKRPRQMAPERLPQETKPSRWFIRAEDVWKGPFLLSDLAGLSFLNPDSWVRRDGEEQVLPAHRDSQVLAVLKGRYGAPVGGAAQGLRECPNCRVGLSRVLYEGAPLDECPACGGCYVTRDQIGKIFAREDYDFPESVKRLAQAIPGVRGKRSIDSKTPGFIQPLKDRPCPSCRSAMVRKFCTEAYWVEVDQCWMCGLTWLDKGELELLQYLYENRKEGGE